MAQKLAQFYAEAAKMGGLKAKMRLAVLTNVPSSKSSSVPDSPENLKKFQAAMMELKKEFR